MNIINFTPLPAFIGGTIIGLAVVIFYLGNGRLAGISGIIKNLVNSNNNRFDNLLFLIGLILGPLIYSFFQKRNSLFHHSVFANFNYRWAISWCRN